jgi:hypothetical protein
MLAGGGHAAAPPRACVLCRAPAALYCRNDDAFLCSSCDLQVHGCSAVLAGHERVPCALLGGGAASCDSGSAATASVTPLDAALRWGLPRRRAACAAGPTRAWAGACGHSWLAGRFMAGRTLNTQRLVAMSPRPSSCSPLSLRPQGPIL